ncbi:kielin/chordin-like protein [Mya arenaria]|uniref:kielin/chordin-like protein n=1 Tax=Mya arenaria TaxID=6604 RepID=UPI0022E1BEAF|nr:kielin/chordin-like protein [Mya arenaria]
MIGLLCVSLCLMCAVVSVWSSPAVRGMSEDKKCEYQDQVFSIGEQITSDSCDRCFCTQFGVMCELIACPEVNCHDAVMGQCCMECPNGSNCLHSGPHGTVTVPREDGCLYTPGLVCFCLHQRRGNGNVSVRVECYPALPGDDKPGVTGSNNGYSRPVCQNATLV